MIQIILLFRVSKPADLEESKDESRTATFPKERGKSNFTTGQSLYTNSIYKDFAFTLKQFNAEFNESVKWFQTPELNKINLNSNKDGTARDYIYKV